MYNVYLRTGYKKIYIYNIPHATLQDYTDLQYCRAGVRFI